MRTLESIQEEIKNIDNLTNSFSKEKEVKHLPKILDDNEHIRYLTRGSMDDNRYYLIVCTQKRMIFLSCGLFVGLFQSEILLERINSISYKTGAMFASLEICHGVSKISIKDSINELAKPFVDAVNLAIKELKNTETSEPKASNQDDTIAKLEKLAALKEKGILTEEEFAQQKAKILAE